MAGPVEESAISVASGDSARFEGRYAKAQRVVVPVTGERYTGVAG